jgi:dipeptidyl aminopeptidase/acylaminoacyl peptidase
VSSTAAPPQTPTTSSDPHAGPELLIEEARRRQRRRRRRVAAFVLVAASAVATSLALLRGRGDGTADVVRVPGGPVVDVADFAGHGRLAFISGRTLWVLDGRTSSLRRIPAPDGLYPSQPLFSPDGRWLAFVRTATTPLDVPGSGAQVGRLWLARGDGSTARPVADLANARLVGWSPTADVLAVVAGPISKRVPFGSSTTVRLVTPDGRNRIRVEARGVRSAAWSPTGEDIAAVTEDGHQHMTLASYPTEGGRASVWGRFGPHTHLNGMTQIVVDVAGWWSGLGIGVWLYGDGMVHNNDETPLDLIAAAGARPRHLASTLSDGTTRVLAAAGGRLAVVADVSHGVNGGRAVWDAKQLQLCARGDCRPVSTDRRDVTLDPAWSSDGRLLAYAQAPDRTSGPWTQGVVSRWYADHRLRVLDVGTGVTRTVAAAGGAAVPIWASDGRGLLFVGDDGVWLLPRLGGKPVEIVRPLFRGAWPSYYGQMAWPAQFAWWTRRPRRS